MRSLVLGIFLILVFVFSGFAVADSGSLDDHNPSVLVDLEEGTVVDPNMMLAGIDYLLERQNELLRKQVEIIEYGVMMLSFLSGVVLAFVFIFGIHLR